MVRDPALVISFGRYATCRGGAISTSQHLILRVNSTGCTWCRTLSAAITLTSAALCLREKSLDPGLVNEVDGSSESSEEDKIQEESNQYR